MNKREPAMTRWYWRQVRGTLIEEFLAVRRTATCGQRLLDGVIVRGGAFRIARREEVSVKGQDVIVVQTKVGRLGMYLMGQAFFSAQLIWQRFKPRSVLSVALCHQDDEVLGPLFKQYPGMEVVLCPEELPAEPGAAPDRPRE